MPAHVLAPELNVEQWFNSPGKIQLAELRGRVVALHAFQMLCPGCVTHGLPQATRIHERFSDEGLTVIGLHTVFEHHHAMSPTALQVFIHEYRLTFPIGVDRAAVDGAVPLTMQAYGLRGTPSLVLIDKRGTVRLNHFGQADDLAVGALIGQLLSEDSASF